MSITIEWVLGTLLAIMSGLLGIVYSKTRENEKRLVRHDILFATLSELPKNLQNHKEREERFFIDLGNKIEAVREKVHSVELIVAQVKKNTNGTNTRS